MDRSFWQDKKVLITGHTGFKGSWLSLWLQNCGASIVGFALTPPTTPSLFHTANVANGMTSITGDIRDFSFVHKVMIEHQPDVIFHMAAQSLVRHSYEHPVETYNTNIMGTVHVLEAFRQLDRKCVLVNITSDKCYENKEWLWGYRENEPMGGHDPYSSSKGCAELVTSAYRRSYFSDQSNSDSAKIVATTRAGNVIGGGDWAKDRLIPDIMNAILAGKSPIIRFPNAIRPWQHVLEPLHGYCCLAEKLWLQGEQYAGAWNFGPEENDVRTVSWIADRITTLWGNGASWKNDAGSHPHEATYLKLDCSKAKTLLKCQPNIDLATALDWIIEWYKAYSQQQEMRSVTEKQISRFEELL